MQINKLFYYYNIARKQRFALLLIVIGITMGAFVYTIFLPRIYVSETVILPTNSSTSQAGGLATILTSISALGGSSGGGSLIPTFLKSQVFRLQVAKSLESAAPLFFPDKKEKLSWDDQTIYQISGMLGGMVKAEVGKGETIRVKVECQNPDLCIQVAQQSLVELQNFLSNNAVTQAKRYRFFLEEQLARNKEELLELGKTLSRFYQKSDVSTVRATLNVPIALNTEQGVRNFKDYEEFRNYFERFQSKNEPYLPAKDVKYVGDVPHQVYIQYLATQQGTLESKYGLLSQSYEVARLEEAKQELSFIVLDAPERPMSPIKPKVSSTVLGAFLVSIFVAFGYILLVDYLRQQLIFEKIKELRKEAA